MAHDSVTIQSIRERLASARAGMTKLVHAIGAERKAYEDRIAQLEAERIEQEQYIAQLELVIGELHPAVKLPARG